MKRENFDVEAFREAFLRHVAVRSKSMKDVSEETGVGLSTLSRFKTEKTMPDAISFAAICGWAGINPASYDRGAAGMRMTFIAPPLTAEDVRRIVREEIRAAAPHTPEIKP